MNNNFQLTQYLVSKICHDLAGDLGVIVTGLDLLDANDTSDVLNLIKTGARRSVAQMKLIRALFAPSASLQSSLNTIINDCEEFLSASKVKFECHCPKNTQLPSSLCKIIIGLVVFNSKILREECGVEIAYQDSLHLICTNPDLKPPQDLDILIGARKSYDAINFSNALPIYINHIASEANIKIEAMMLANKMKYVIIPTVNSYLT